MMINTSVLSPPKYFNIKKMSFSKPLPTSLSGVPRNVTSKEDSEMKSSMYFSTDGVTDATNKEKPPSCSPIDYYLSTPARTETIPSLLYYESQNEQHLDNYTAGEGSDVVNIAIVIGLGPLKLIHYACGWLVIPVAHILSGGVGIAMIVIGSELIHFNPQGPLKLLQYQNVMSSEAFDKAGKVLMALGGILLYDFTDYFFLSSIMNHVNDLNIFDRFKFLLNKYNIM